MEIAVSPFGEETASMIIYLLAKQVHKFEWFCDYRLSFGLVPKLISFKRVFRLRKLP